VFTRIQIRRRVKSSGSTLIGIHRSISCCASTVLSYNAVSFADWSNLAFCQNSDWPDSSGISTPYSKEVKREAMLRHHPPIQQKHDEFTIGRRYQSTDRRYLMFGAINVVVDGDGISSSLSCDCMGLKSLLQISANQ